MPPASPVLLGTVQRVTGDEALVAAAFAEAVSALGRLEPAGSGEDLRRLVAASFCGVLRDAVPHLEVTSLVTSAGLLHVLVEDPSLPLGEGRVASVTLLLPDRLRDLLV